MSDVPGAQGSFVRRSADYASGSRAPALQELGGKGRALAELTGTLPVPAWFVLTPAAFTASVSRETLKAIRSFSPSPLELAGVRPSDEVSRQLQLEVARLCPDGGFVAVRSSATDEDSAHSSFAGQLESYLFVASHLVPDRVADVWRSAFSDRVMAYRRERGIAGFAGAPAVIIQRMVEADVSGVAFSADPISGDRDVAVIGALYGLGTALVSGECDADTYHVTVEGEITQRDIADKRHAHRPMPGEGEGVVVCAVDASRARLPALSDDEIRRVAGLARSAQRTFGEPQDVEWAMQRGQLFLLQSRPITTLATPDNQGPFTIWDNSNIAESYGGVTTPLTFSFARHAYDGAYRQFCRLMCISESTIAAHDETFANMLGLIRGRVYYNLLNWYRILALLPGYRLNRRFMEQMMGVKEPLPDGALGPHAPVTMPERIRDAWNVARVGVAFIGQYATLERRCDAFFKWLDSTLGSKRIDYANATPKELAAAYRHLESRLTTRWDAPLINDLFAMIFFGALRGLCERWCGDSGGTLQNGLVGGEGGMISAQPAALVTEMARDAAPDAGLVSALCSGTPEQARAAVDRTPRLRERYQEYLDRFGDRTTDELKLESPTLHDDPLMLLQSIGRLAERFAQEPGASRGPEPGQTQRAQAESRVAGALRGHPLRRAVFAWVLRNARRRIVARENLRFERTRLFARVRSIFRALGESFARAGVLREPDDIFYLEVDEALGCAEGTVDSNGLAALTQQRRRQFDQYRAMPAPPDRFETRTGEAIVPTARISPQTAQEASADQRAGLGCCPGVVRGRVRVVTDPRRAALRAGEILVAERTDPGWVMLFPAAAGLLVERGSLLSHSAIVAREMRIPAVVSLSGVTTWLKDGDWVELDGSTGVVHRLSTGGVTEGAHA